MNRIVKAHTPLGEDQLMFRSMHGTEGLSQLFEFEVDLLSPNASIDMKSVLGKPLTLEILTISGAPRYLDGQITRFTVIGREGKTERHTVYRAQVRPWLWYLTRSSDNKIFQNKTVVEIVEEVLGDYGFPFEKKLSNSYRQWEYCVQYGESDFAFISRLMELEGIYYFFKHEKNKHTLVLADDIGAHETVAGYEQIDHFAADREITEDMEVIREWQPSEEVRSGSYTVDDYNFTTPKGDLVNVRSQPRAHDNAGYDMYEWLGDYPAQGDGEHYARMRLEESQSLAVRSAGQATVRGLAPGYKFNMRNSPRADDNQEYLAVQVAYALREGGYATGEEPGNYDFNFVVQPVSTPFRAARETPVPRTSGPQTATVVGPAGEEIWTDKYGRVKVQFHWDRYGQRDENSSRFVRVSHIWAGERFGGVFMPRIGQEVIVDFISGRPDRPVIVGRVYNADQMPPFDLPGEATKSGVVTRSTPGGSQANANVLMFEDKKGAEQVLLHAERNLDVEVEGDETHTTDKTRTTLIKGHESATYESGEERHITGGALEEITGGETRTVEGGAKETITGGETRDITGGAKETIAGGETRTVTGGMKETISGGLDQTITGGIKEIIGGGINSTITGGVRQTISGGVNQTINDGMNFTVNGGFHSNVLGDHTTVVEGGKTTTTTGPDTTNTPEKTTNTPQHTVNAANEDWWRWTDNHGTLEHTGAWAFAADLYGLKAQVSLLNAQFNGTFMNISRINMITARVKLENTSIKVKDEKVSSVRGGLCFAAKKLFIRI
ncbi:type VI secretion system tip protein TssI/VgrG [Variovorax sp. EBFNA2]|uniref:type VI secretion system Vgr family protein n=1 Tax=Variovorax sp. EBFNA2 TaxID=3342097 RepID=UPI0029C03DE0|nr:type VI secretion system tip protein TssI/VgrG [Variovorax boronicumulans]WPG37989.1 type VI secretion system tip protein TssI/VgrG [Variovorax boronicumulans]